MDKILPRKYNNPVTIGLAVALVVAVGVIIYYMTREEPKPIIQQYQPQPAAQQVKSEHVETKVFNNNKPVLLLIWADWCGHSMNMKPAWDKVASILNEGGVVEAVDFESKTNATDIETIKPSIPEFRGFPHIRFYPDGFGPNNRSIVYSGERTEEDLLKFAYSTK
jgi:thiol-disulfide isomerase/thioredoxin